MAWTTYQIGLAFAMVITGSINTLSTKWADLTKAEGKDDSQPRNFDHPFLQACGMFLGEVLCLVAFYMALCCNPCRAEPRDLGNMKFNRAIFLPAALLDMLSTSLMYVGLNLTFASSFQMLRGSVIIFTALLSSAFLGRTIRVHQWVGITFITVGLVLVGLSDVFFGPVTQNMNSIIAGDLIIIIAQIIGATQMVYEEKYVTRLDVHPLQAVGWEGLFGFLVLGLLLIPMYHIQTGAPFTSNPNGRLEDPFDAFYMIRHNWQIAVATAGNIISIALFNFSGISVTKELSATTRMVLDSVRTIVIWGVSLGVKWQVFRWDSFALQLVGFVILLLGMCIYNDVFFGPLLRKHKIIGPLKEIVRDSRPGLDGDFGDQDPIMPSYFGPSRRNHALQNSDDEDDDDGASFFDEDSDAALAGRDHCRQLLYPNAANNIAS